MTKEELMRKAIELSVQNVAEGGAGRIRTLSANGLMFIVFIFFIVYT